MEELQTRKERERQFRRKEIMTAARAIFSTRGFSNATLEEIAEKAEFGKGTIYNYFQSKEELFYAVISEVLSTFISIARTTCIDEKLPFHQAYMEFAKRMMIELLKNMDVVSLFMREMHKPGQVSFVAEHLGELLTIIEHPMKEAIDQKIIPHDRTRQIAFLYLAMIFTLCRSEFHIDISSCCSIQPGKATIRNEPLDIVEDNLRLLQITFFEGIINSSNMAKETA